MLNTFAICKGKPLFTLFHGCARREIKFCYLLFLEINGF